MADFLISDFFTAAQPFSGLRLFYFHIRLLVAFPPHCCAERAYRYNRTWKISHQKISHRTCLFA